MTKQNQAVLASFIVTKPIHGTYIDTNE